MCFIHMQKSEFKYRVYVYWSLSEGFKTIFRGKYSTVISVTLVKCVLKRLL